MHGDMTEDWYHDELEHQWLPKAIDFCAEWGLAYVPLQIRKEMTRLKDKFDIFPKDKWANIPVSLERGCIITGMECDEFGKPRSQENKRCELLF